MCKAMEEMRNECTSRADKEAKIGIAIKLIKDGTLSLDKIAAVCNLTGQCQMPYEKSFVKRMLFELAHPVLFDGDFEDFGPTHEFSEHGRTLITANI